MEFKDEIKAKEILEAVSRIMSSVDDLEKDQPIVLSCGGIYLKGRKVPKNLISWKMPLFLPNSDIRFYRMNGESGQRCFRRVLAGGFLN